MDVISFHRQALTDIGFVEVEDLIVDVPCMRFGKNSNERICQEHIIKFKKR